MEKPEEFLKLIDWVEVMFDVGHDMATLIAFLMVIALFFFICWIIYIIDFKIFPQIFKRKEEE